MFDLLLKALLGELALSLLVIFSSTCVSGIMAVSYLALLVSKHFDDFPSEVLMDIIYMLFLDLNLKCGCSWTIFYLFTCMYLNCNIVCGRYMYFLQLFV